VEQVDEVCVGKEIPIEKAIKKMAIKKSSLKKKMMMTVRS
jgi:hypothetical protein